MTEPTPPLTLLQRREIEAKVIAPLIAEVQQELGQERTIALLRRVIEGLARADGADLARAYGEATLQAFARALDLWTAGGALEIDLIEQSEERLSFDVKRCRYAEMYRALGLADLGPHLSCCRDFAMVQGFSPEIELTRTQTLMEGAPCCDFRFRRRDPGAEPGRD